MTQTRSSFVLSWVSAACLLLLLPVSPAADSNVFASSAHLQLLANEEIKLVSSLKSYIDSERRRLDEMQRLITEIEGIHLNPVLASPSHPINAFRLIHRFTTTWNSIQQLFRAETSASVQEFESVKTSLEFHWPSSADFDGAKMALIRLQKTYNLATADLLAGSVAGRETMQPLSQQMALEIAILCLKNGFFDESLDWLTNAQSHLVPPLSSKKELLMTMGVLFWQKGVSQPAANSTIQEENLRAINQELDIFSSINEPEVWPLAEPNYEILCQEGISEKPKTQLFLKSDHYCLYRRSTTVPFYKYRVEYYHRSPDVVLFHDFASDAESKALQERAATKLERAHVGTVTANRASNFRVGKIAWFWDAHGDVLIDRISQRISDVTGLNVTYPTGEPLQLSNYGIGGHYHLHYDHDTFRFHNPTQESPEIQLAGDRIATFMIYLNNVEAGGATVFPRLNLAARPIKNAAIFWYNYKRSGEQDEKSLHAACPVLIGQKWVANKWIREFGQEFRRPCDLTRD